MGQQHDFYLVQSGNLVPRAALWRGFLACFQQPSLLRPANLDSSDSATGHGGDKELRELLREKGPDYAEKFQFGILEIADTNASDGDVRRRESRWKELLLTRQPHGYNAN